MTNKIKFSFFGSSRFSVIVLDELEILGLIPYSIVTTPDKAQGRKMIVTPTEVKEWAQKRSITVHSPEKLDTDFAIQLEKEKNDVFIVASYGKIIPLEIINIPVNKTLNIHPSLLPKYRGASPLQSAILDNTKETGITIIQIDEQMDHGPIIAQEKVSIEKWPTYEDFEEMMAIAGAKLLAKVLPEWIRGKIEKHDQDHSIATFTKKVKKEDGLINLDDDPYKNFLKIQAYQLWPQAYFMIKHNGKEMRVKITKADFENDKLLIKKVIPEGGKEMSFEDFGRGYNFSLFST
ncbi:MAG: methionyl-tRNA formyltransferase [Candidatus Paceibacterota bacterium]|jgi:methionyl-tRNA formyltransferase